MSQAQGHQFGLRLTEESAYKTDPGSPSSQLLYVISSGLKVNKGKIPNATLNQSRGMELPAPANVDVNGPLSMYINPESIGTFLKHCFGTVDTSGSDPYTHAYTIGALPVGMVLEHDYGGSVDSAARYEKFNGCKVNRARFAFPIEGWPTIQADIMGAAAAFASSPLDATPDDNGATPFHMHESSITEGGGSIGIVTQSEIVLENNLQGNNYVIGGGGNRYSLPEGKVGIVANVTALFESKALLDKALNNTETSLGITLSRGDGNGSAGNESLVMTVQQMVYEQTSPEVAGPEGLMVNLTGHGYLSGSDVGLAATLKNAVATV